jgi:hypothetical protein
MMSLTSLPVLGGSTIAIAFAGTQKKVKQRESIPWTRKSVASGVLAQFSMKFLPKQRRNHKRTEYD